MKKLGLDTVLVAILASITPPGLPSPAWRLDEVSALRQVPKYSKNHFSFYTGDWEKDASLGGLDMHIQLAAIDSAIVFIENLRVPQTINDAALQLLQVGWERSILLGSVRKEGKMQYSIVDIVTEVAVRKTIETLDRKIADELRLHTYSDREQALNVFLLKLEVDEELFDAVCIVGYLVHSKQAELIMPGETMPNDLTREIRSIETNVFKTMGKARLEAFMANLGFAIYLSTLAVYLCSGGRLRFPNPRHN